MAALRDERLLLAVDAAGTAWPDRVPFRINHLGDVLAELQVDRRDDTFFEAFGELDEATAARLARFSHVSPHVQFLEARIVGTGVVRHVEVTKSELVELSAVDRPGLPDTVLYVGKPGDRWVPKATVERFARLRGPDRLTLTFPSTVEVVR